MICRRTFYRQSPTTCSSVLGAALIVQLGCAVEQGAAPELGTGTMGSTMSGDAGTTSHDASEVTTGEVDTDGSESAGASKGGSNDDCHDHDECTDPGAPFCVVGKCVSCAQISDADEACAEMTPETPVCSQGVCVSCSADNIGVCGGTTPICNADSNTCVPCTEHSQCEASACHLEKGSCIAGPTVMVSNMGELRDALNTTGPGQEKTVIMTGELTEEDAYYGGFGIPSGAVVALVAASGSKPIVAAEQSLVSVNGPLLNVPAGATLYVEGIGFAPSGKAAIDLGGGTGHFSRALIFGDSEGPAVRVSGGGKLSLVNSCVLNDDATAITVEGGRADILYSFLVGGEDVGSRALQCTPQDDVTIRNSIAVSWAGGDELECEAMTISRSLTQSTVAGEHNVRLPLGTKLFEDGGILVLSSDFFPRLTPYGSTLAAGVARWQEGDPQVDIDGQARPTTPGALDFAGADVPE